MLRPWYFRPVFFANQNSFETTGLTPKSRSGIDVRIPDNWSCVVVQRKCPPNRSAKMSV